MILAVARNRLMNLRRDRAAFVLAFVLPLAFFSIFAGIFAGSGRAGTRKVFPVRSQRNSTCKSRSSKGTRLVGLDTSAVATSPRHCVDRNVWQATVSLPSRIDSVGTPL